ncbi:MAG: two-component system, OmpR family, sensor kinase [Candidatus Eremiobacteraeota bacterium]|nr:two-component system, OmpR family, sensor kinase [Candidatus Eremiobacteraeota bacterium]
MRPSITVRLTALWSALLVVALLLFATLAIAFSARSAQQSLDQRLLAETAVVASSVEPKSGTIDADAPRAVFRNSTVVVFRDGKPVQVIGERPGDGALRAAAALAPDVPATVVADEPYRIAARLVPGVPSLRVAAFASEDPVGGEIDRLRRTFVLVGIPVVAVAILAGFLLARGSLAPIDRLTRTADEVARTGRFSARFTVATQDELGRLGATFNAMLATLEATYADLAATYERERAFIGDVSHELRQPLTSIAGEAQLAMRDGADSAAVRNAFRRIDAETRGLRALIDDLLVIARADAHALGTGSAEIGEAVAEATNAVRPEFPAIAMTVELATDPMTVAVPGSLAVHLVTNLVRNAAQSARTSVRVEVAVHDTDAVVTVDDDGPGIPQADRERVFRRFERLAGGRAAGTGLGLAIAAAIVRVGGGTISIGDAPARARDSAGAAHDTAGGARVTVRLPVRV